MNATIDAKCVKLDSSPTMHLPFAIIFLGPKFLARIKEKYDLYSDKPHMNKKVSTSCGIESAFPTKCVVGALKFHSRFSDGFKVSKDVSL